LLRWCCRPGPVGREINETPCVIKLEYTLPRRSASVARTPPLICTVWIGDAHGEFEFASTATGSTLRAQHDGDDDPLFRYRSFACRGRPRVRGSDICRRTSIGLAQAARARSRMPMPCCAAPKVASFKPIERPRVAYTRLLIIDGESPKRSDIASKIWLRSAIH